MIRKVPNIIWNSINKLVSTPLKNLGLLKTIYLPSPSLGWGFFNAFFCWFCSIQLSGTLGYEVETKPPCRLHYYHKDFNIVAAMTDFCLTSRLWNRYNKLRLVPESQKQKWLNNDQWTFSNQYEKNSRIYDLTITLGADHYLATVHKAAVFPPHWHLRCEMDPILGYYLF